jgi:predicted GNAT superfamily acetyltransferase
MLKFEQHRRALDMGLEAVVWAFDPLQASNAAFNLGVLGAVCRTYEVDMYGSRTDTLNAGLATDRLLAEWSTARPPGGRTEEWLDGLDLIATKRLGHLGFNEVDYIRAIPHEVTHLHLEIPPNISNLKSYGPSNSAVVWQQALRQAFQAAFDAGFVAVGFSRADPHRPKYLLERNR